MSEKTNRLYSDLAWLWPMWGNTKGEYAVFCEHITQLIKKYSKRDIHSLLNMGCGGGKNAFNLKKHFAITGIDISPAMLDLAEKLNPECTFLKMDMRYFSLKSEFDAVLIDDAVSYMITESDLYAVFNKAYEHLAPDGVMVVVPDSTKETFKQNATHVYYAESDSKPKNIDVVYIENNYDPDPKDDTFEGMMIYLIRENGELRIEQDLDILGLFSLELWEKLLYKVGFEIFKEKYVEEQNEYTLFVCLKPA